MRTALAVLRSDLDHLSDDVKELKGTLSWLNKLIISLIVTAVVSGVLYAGPLG